jgi:hypothetical protein
MFYTDCIRGTSKVVISRWSSELATTKYGILTYFKLREYIKLEEFEKMVEEGKFP